MSAVNVVRKSEKDRNNGAGQKDKKFTEAALSVPVLARQPFGKFRELTIHADFPLQPGSFTRAGRPTAKQQTTRRQADYVLI